MFLGVKNVKFIYHGCLNRSMFWWFGKKRHVELEKKTQEGFGSVKKDVDAVVKWIKHLDKQDKQLFDLVNLIKNDLSTLKDDVESLMEGVEEINDGQENKHLFKKLPVWGKQAAVEDVQTAVQTAVQTGNIYDILRRLSVNERALMITLMNSEMKLSYEDLALLLGKERSTVRGQINSIKQKSEGLIEEVVEKNGKKRVYVPEEIKEKMQKYAKVRVKKGKKDKEREEKE